MLLRFLIPVGLIISLSLTACNDSGFTGDSSAARKKTSAATPPPKPTPAPGFTVKVQKFTAAKANMVDVVIGVDTSGSMVEEMQSIEQNVQTFLNGLNRPDLDAKVTVVAKVSSKESSNDPMGMGKIFNFPAGLPADRFAMVDQYIHSNDAIGILSQFFAGKFGFPLPLREGAPVEMIIISDDNGSNIGPFGASTTGNLATEFVGPAGKALTTHSIVGLAGSVTTDTCEITNPGTEFEALAKQSNGLVLDICQSDWTGLLKKISDAIVSRNSGYVLEHQPAVDQQITVKVNGTVVAASNYTIDAGAKNLKFADTYPLPLGAEIEVTYSYK